MPDSSLLSAMHSDARLESLVFQLTPTRTRCDLVITSNGKTEKVASGFLNPFLAHLKTAQDQSAKGGYSIKLQPAHGTDAPWFTKDTVEKFVRFVSTPEILERVNTIEREILQIEEAMAIQGNEGIFLDNVGDHQIRPSGSIEGYTSVEESDAEKAIVLYKPDAHEPDSNGSTMKAENSKVQLLRVLKTRKNILRKEQGMAFARAAAAGFNIDQMANLVSFAECFGASRLLVACIKFMELWKGKHETGQWIEIEATDSMSLHSDFSSANALGIFLAADTSGHIDIGNGKHNGDSGTEYLDSDSTRGRTSGDPQVSLGSNKYLQGQCQHPMFPQWPMHSLPGAPGVRPYPIQGMPYYQSYAGNSPFFQSPYSTMEDPGYGSLMKVKTKRHSVDGKDSNDGLEMDDGMDQDALELDKDASKEHGSHRNGGQLKKSKSGMVVIQNINYITSKRHSASGSETGSDSYETEEDLVTFHNEAPERKHKKSSSFSKNKEKLKGLEPTNSYEVDANSGQEAGSENWQAFQNFLLRGEDNGRSAATGDALFSGEKLQPTSRRQSSAIADPMLPPDRSSSDVLEQRVVEFDKVTGRMILKKKATESDEDLACSNDGRIIRDSKLDIKLQEMDVGGSRYKRGPSDDFMISGQGKQIISRNSLDPLSEKIYKPGDNFGEKAYLDITDESFLVPSRPFSQEHVRLNSQADIDLDMPPALHHTKESSLRNKSKAREIDDLSLMPDRRTEGRYTGNDPAIDDVMIAHANDTINGRKKDIPAGVKENLKKLDKEKKSRASRDGSEKKKIDSLRRRKSSRSNPLAEAQERAGKLRAYKADLQKERKEKEEQEKRRLEALKRERQKRIAVRGTSSAIQTPTTPQNQKQVPTKLSPSSHSSSKFSDSGPRSLSIHRKLPVNIGSSDSQKTSKNSGLYCCRSAGNNLRRSVSSLSETANRNSVLVPERKKGSSSKQLSDPSSSVSHAASVKSASRSQVSIRNISGLKGTNIPHGLPVISDGSTSERFMCSEQHIKKISAIIQPDKSKSVIRRELNTKMPMGTLSAVGKRSNVKEAAHKANVSKTTLISADTKTQKSTGKTHQLNDGDDNLLVEKSTVIQEKEMVPVHSVALSESNKGEITGIIPECGAIQNPLLTMNSSEVKKVAVEYLPDERPTYEVTVDCVKDEIVNFSSFATEKLNQTSVTQASSMKDSSAIALNQSEALPITSSVARSGSQNFQRETPTSANINRVEPKYEKPQHKESSKGFKRLLKFRRKSHSSASDECNLVSDYSSIYENATTTASSHEATTLKSLICEDDSHSESISKVSRSFSILSPFRGKTSGKKIVG